MPLFLSNADQAQCITPREAVDVLEDAIRQFARGEGIRRPRIDNILPTSRPAEYFNFSSMEGGYNVRLKDGRLKPGYYALRIKPDIYSFPVVDGVRRQVTYSYRPGLYGGLVFLYSVDNAEFLAIMNDGFVQHMRVAASVGLGIRYLSRTDSRVMGIIGSGGMARVFPLTAKAVRPIERLQVYSPNRQRLEQYCAEMADKLGGQIVPMASAEAAARDVDILSACTTAYEPVVKAEWIKPGMHLNNVVPFEFGPDTCAKVDVVGILARRTPLAVEGFADDNFGVLLDVLSYAGGGSEVRSQIPVGSLRSTRDRYPNARIVECCNWETSVPYRREPDEITILANASNGTLEGPANQSDGIQGIQFSSLAGWIYERARDKGLGTELPRDMFLQDTPT